MRALIYAVTLSLLSAPVLGADSNRIIALEQDVRNLERLVGTLEREIRDLRRGAIPPPNRLSESRPSDRSSSDWVSAAKWKQVYLGMSELEVIEILGEPTAMRVEDDSRLLLYALEIGSSGFLSGSVRLRDGEVAEVQVPALR
jgi:hypothetical protein